MKLTCRISVDISVNDLAIRALSPDVHVPWVLTTVLASSLGRGLRRLPSVLRRSTAVVRPGTATITVALSEVERTVAARGITTASLSREPAS